MGSLGLPEIIFILLLALLIFGPKRLPEIGRTLGKGMAEFRKASNDLKRTINAELALDEDEQARLPRRIESPVPSFVQAVSPPQEAPAGTVAQTPETPATSTPPAAVTPETLAATTASAASAASTASTAWVDPTAPAPPEPVAASTTPIEPS